MQQVRAGVAAERGFKLYDFYDEQQAAHFLRRDYTTIKRWRKKGLIVPSPHGDGVRYLGLVLADFIIGGWKAMEKWRRMFAVMYEAGSEKWPATASENSKSDDTGSISETAPQPGTDAGSKDRAQSALALARQIVGKPSGS